LKTEMRSHLLKNLKSLSGEEKSQKSSAIEAQLANLLKNEKGYWAGYQNLADEPVVRWPVISKKIDWCFPVVENEILKFKCSPKSFYISELGIKEPGDGDEVQLDEINGSVMPGVGFDHHGFRLGRGKGFYDRALADYKGKKIGVCYEISFCKELPQEDHDIQCQHVVTEKSVYQTGPSEGVSKWS
jgi:5-formyltetrahydrofolate cyclo-ligase